MYLKILLIGLFIFTSIYAKTNDYTTGERKNQIKSTELTNDNEYLEITLRGDFFPKSNFDLFINSDGNKATGYIKDGKIKGAEYLVENHTLFAYAGNGSSWKWTKLGKIESHTSEILWNAKIPLSSLDVNRGERIEYIAKVMTQDWQKGSYGKGGIFTILQNEKESLFTLTQSGEFSQFTHFSFFIDVDNNSNTGYTRGKIKGADFLVEDNGLLYKYPKDATGWKWDRVQDDIVFTHTDDMMQMEISSILLGNTKFITYYAMVSTSDWKRNDILDAQSLNNTINIDNQMITYSELDGNIKNPERGLYTNHYLPSSEYKMGKYTAHSVPGNLGWILQGDYRVFVEKLILIDFKDKAISKNYLDIVRSEFEAVRKNGLKMILRVTYNESMQETDAPLHIVLNHIEQLNPIFNEFKDVIMTVQAGFIGAWGEWHSSTHGLDKDNHAKDAIKNALLKAVPSSITVQFRKPSEIIRWYPSSLTSKDAYTSNNQSRIGFHDDCFNWSASDMGTFRGDATNIKLQKEYISKISRFTPFMGETCNEDITHAAASTTSCENALEMAEKMHLTSLGNVFVNNDNITTPVEIYHNEGCWDEIVRRLGYRFVLKSATLPTVATINNSFSGEIKIENNGFSSLVNRRETYIVLENENKRFEFKLNTDPRKWEPNKTITIQFHTILPNSLKEGKYKVALWLPDIHENLKDNPKYAIRTANTNSWDSQKGYNVLGEVECIAGNTPKVFTLNSSNFIPEHGSPSFSWKSTPIGTKSLVLIIDDKSAKDGTLDWVHWSVIDIDKNTHNIVADTIPTGSKIGINSNGVNGYSDPAYPHTHKYVAHLYALDTDGAKNFNLHKKYDHKEFERVFGSYILGKSEITSM